MPKTKSALNKYSQAKGKDKMRTLPKRASLTIAQKHEICFKKINEPYIKNKELAELYNVSEGCISDTLKKSQKWLEIDPQAPEAQGKRQNKLNFPEIEEALTLWVLKALENGVDISDQGIINSFKAQYQKLLLQNRIKAFDFQQLTGNSKSPINIKKAIKYVVSAWNKVLPKTIFNCWNKTGILPDDTNSYNEIEENRHNETEENEYREIQDLINKLEYTHPLTAEEYIRLDQENENAGIPPSEEQIVAILKENNTMSDNEGDKDIISVTSSEALIAFDTIFNYVEQNDSQDIFDKSALKVMKKIRKIVYRNNFFSKKQSSLDLFVTDKGSKLKPNNTAIDPVDNNTMNREREGDNNIIDIENFDFEALYFNEFDFYNYEEDQGFIEYQIDENSLYK
ncbi:unnamed protein product [Rhizophagus irregularis]|uniref:DDE-1 domain-containing protein n=1 Tax=Rhizophagus irregularis TaxID=588596 RepID=A0A915ZHR9_9GLOM|nr:unnamed protein product [Rhizophagus irregularis]